MIKYAIIGYILLMLLILFEFSQMISVKAKLEKQVAGIKTEIEKINNYEKQILDFETSY